MSSLYIEKSGHRFAIRRPGSARACAILPTQAEAIARSRELDPRATIFVARFHVQSGKDKWRKI